MVRKKARWFSGTSSCARTRVRLSKHPGFEPHQNSLEYICVYKYMKKKLCNHHDHLKSINFIDGVVHINIFKSEAMLYLKSGSFEGLRISFRTMIWRESWFNFFCRYSWQFLNFSMSWRMYNRTATVLRSATISWKSNKIKLHSVILPAVVLPIMLPISIFALHSVHCRKYIQTVNTLCIESEHRTKKPGEMLSCAWRSQVDRGGCGAQRCCLNLNTNFKSKNYLHRKYNVCHCLKPSMSVTVCHGQIPSNISEHDTCWRAWRLLPSEGRSKGQWVLWSSRSTDC